MENLVLLELITIYTYDNAVIKHYYMYNIIYTKKWKKKKKSRNSAPWAYAPGRNPKNSFSFTVFIV